MLINKILNTTFSGKLFTSDLDGTILIPVGGQEANIKRNLEDRAYYTDSFYDVFEKASEANIDDIHIATGRNITELYEVKDLFESIPKSNIGAISINDGNILLKKPQEMTSEEWIKELFDSNANPMRFSDKQWAKKVNKSIAKIKEYLVEKEGFIHYKNDGDNIIFRKNIDTNDAGVKKVNGRESWNVIITPPKTTFKVGTVNCDENSDVNLQEYNEYLTSKIFEYLKSENIAVLNPQTSEETFCVNTLERLDINKGTVADYYAKSTNKGKSEQQIRAGNSYNDFSLLNKKIPSIVVGDDEYLRSFLAQSKNTPSIFAKPGELGKTLNLVA